jgi:hypothetical protein
MTIIIENEFTKVTYEAKKSSNETATEMVYAFREVMLALSYADGSIIDAFASVAEEFMEED